MIVYVSANSFVHFMNTPRDYCSIKIREEDS
jgi:hypothetical protein